jgi:hypothetical protein
LSGGGFRKMRNHDYAQWPWKGRRSTGDLMPPLPDMEEAEAAAIGKVIG